MTYGPDGAPNGVSIVRSLRSVSSAISYSPLPPTIPTSIFSSSRSLIRPFSLVFSDVGRRYRRIVLEEHERFLRRKSVHRIQVVAHDPRVRQVGRRRHEIGREDRRLAVALDVDDLVMHAV